MKDKQKSLEDLDFLTELTPSEQEEINGGFGDLTSEGKPIIVGDSTRLPPSEDAFPMWDIHKPENPNNMKARS
jgi:hypothetical protein